MKKIFILLATVACLLACESVNYVPPVTPQMAAPKRGQRVDVVVLRKGRTLLVNRCIECHTLPPLWHYSVEDWPKIVNTMSHRASLKPAERDAVVAYILAVRSNNRRKAWGGYPQKDKANSRP